jgi:hypothetical protein
MPLMPTLLLAALLFGVSMGQQAPGNGVGILDTGVVIAGSVAPDRYDDNTKFKFTITDPNGSFATILSDVVNDSLSYDWLQPLVRARRASVRIADTREMSSGTASPDIATHIASCSSSKPEERTNNRIFFGLNCVAFDQRKWSGNDKATPWLDFIIVVSTSKGSFTDTFLNKNQEKGGTLYVRLEEVGR